MEPNDSLSLGAEQSNLTGRWAQHWQDVNRSIYAVIYQKPMVRDKKSGIPFRKGYQQDRRYGPKDV